MILTIIIAFAIAPADEIGSILHGFIGKTQRVGTHIGDQTQRALAGHIHTFIQLLGNGHGALGGETQLAGCFLLQGRSGKGRRGGLFLFRLLHIGDGKLFTFNVMDHFQRFRFVIQFTLLFLAPVVGNERTGLADPIQIHIQCPVFLGNKGTDLIFPIHNQSGGHTLDTAGRQTPTDFLPQQGRKLVTHDAVQHTAGLLGIHQIVVNISGGTDGRLDHLLGDLIEGDTLCLLIGKLQQLLQMPGNGFSFTVRVGCEVDGIHLRGGLFQFLDQFFLTSDRNVLGGKILLQIYTHLALGQIPQVTHAGLDNIIRSQIFSNRLCLGRRLDDHKIARFCHEWFSISTNLT